MNSDDDIRNYCPSCGGNFVGNAGFCDCAIGRQIQRYLTEHARFRQALITLRMKLADAVLLDFREIAALALKPKKEKFAVSRDVLSLVGRKLTRAAWATWSEAERVRAMEWASSVHLRASDHVVRVPKIPSYVAALSEVRS